MMSKYLEGGHRKEAEVSFFSLCWRLGRVEVTGRQFLLLYKEAHASNSSCLVKQAPLETMTSPSLETPKRWLEARGCAEEIFPHLQRNSVPGSFFLQSQGMSAFKRQAHDFSETPSHQPPRCWGGERVLASRSGTCTDPGVPLVLPLNAFKVSCWPQWKEHGIGKKESWVCTVVPSCFTLTSKFPFPDL